MSFTWESATKFSLMFSLLLFSKSLFFEQENNAKTIKNKIPNLLTFNFLIILKFKLLIIYLIASNNVLCVCEVPKAFG